MKLPNWIMLCVLLVGAMGQYSINAVANTGSIEQDVTTLDTLSALSRANAPSEATSLLNINSASAEELSNLPGIGAKKAIAIVEYRELNGQFTSVEELVNVKGIGPKMLAKLNGYISI